MELLDDWMVGRKSKDPIEMYRYKTMLLEIDISDEKFPFGTIWNCWTIGRLGDWTVGLIVLMCKFCKISKTITNVLYSTDIFVVSYLFGHFMELLDDWELLDGWTLGQFVLICKFCKSVKPSQNFIL